MVQVKFKMNYLFTIDTVQSFANNMGANLGSPVHLELFAL